MDDQAVVNFLKENNARHTWHHVADPKVSEANPPLTLIKGDGFRDWRR